MPLVWMSILKPSLLDVAMPWALSEIMVSLSKMFGFRMLLRIKVVRCANENPKYTVHENSIETT